MQYFNDDFSHVHLAPEQLHTTAGSEKIPDDATPCIVVIMPIDLLSVKCFYYIYSHQGYPLLRSLLDSFVDVDEEHWALAVSMC